jgi:glycosyltransferase involved in cell wall biosynthesis
MQAILAAVAQDPPDVFVANYSVPAYFCTRLLRQAGVLAVGTLHSDDPYYHDLVDLFVLGDEPWRLSGVVTVSNFLSQSLQDAELSSVPVLHAPYGAPMPESRCVWREGRLTLAYFGRLVEHQKRISRVVRSMAAAADLVPGVEGVVYGAGDDELVDGLIVDAGVVGQVRRGGALGMDGVQQAMLDSQVLVLLSDFEGFSIALMEAMACGLVPIVTRMRSGVEDVIEDGVNGFIIEPDDDVSFVAAVRSLARNQSLWERMSAEARQSMVRGGFTSGDCARKWAEFLTELASLSSTPRSLPVSSAALYEVELPPPATRDNGIRGTDRRCSSLDVVAAARAGRPLYLWGASKAGEWFLDGIVDFKHLPIEGFIDSDPRRQKKGLRGYVVHSPAQFQQLLKGDPKPFVLITSQFAAEISTLLREMGMSEHQDFGRFDL